MFKQTAQRLAVLGLSAATLVAPLAARAADGDIPSAATQLAAITTSVAGYSTVFFGIAIASVGIMIGVKWIKRSRGAA